MKEFIVKMRAVPWIRHLAMGVLYGLLYYLARSLNVLHLSVIDGFRLAWLLLVPYRYWPAALLGEAVSLVYYNTDVSAILGTRWMIFASLPPLGVDMLVVWLFRKYLIGSSQIDATKMGRLLLCGMAVSLLHALVNAGCYLVANMFPGEQRSSQAKVFAFYLMNNYLGVLMLVPLVLLLAQAIQGGAWRRWSERLASMPGMLSLEICALVVIELAYCLLGVLTKDETWRGLLQIGLFIPVIWSALRFGWRGASLAGTVAVVGYAFLLPQEGAAVTYTTLAQALLGLIITTFLLLGARTSSLRQTLRESQRNVELTRQELYLAELRMRGNAKELDRVHANLQQAHNQLLSRLGYFVPETEALETSEQLSAARSRLYRLADSLSPRQWQRNGRPEALWRGPIADVLEVELGIAYEADPRGDLSRLPPETNMLLYRLGCEAVTFLLTHTPTDRISLRTRTGGYEHAMWVELVVNSEGESIEPPSHSLLLTGLGTSGLGEQEMAHRTEIYKGTFKLERRASGGGQIAIKLTDINHNFDVVAPPSLLTADFSPGLPVTPDPRQSRFNTMAG